MIDVVLFSRPQSYRTMSMDIYADNLLENMRNLSGISIRAFRPKELPIPLVGKYSTLWLYYPFVVKRQKSADINHILDHSIAHLIPALDHKRTVITCHDLMGLEVPESTPFWKRKIFWRNIIRNMLKAQKIIAGSQHTKNDILKYSSYKSSDIVVVYEGINTTFRRIEKNKIEERFKFRKPAILHVGHANFYKNVEGLIRAIALLGKDVKLVKVGTFSSRQFKLLKNLRIDFVQFTHLSEQELVQLYNAVDLLVYPSWHEGFGFPVVEAMACGCPVICSNLSSLPEVAADAAITVAPDDTSGIAKAIAGALESHELRQELIEQGLRQASNFNWKKTSQETLEVYKSILN